MSQVEITFEEHKLLLVGYYQPAEKMTQNYPGAPEEFEVTEVYVGDYENDISALLGDEQKAAIERLALETIAEAAEDAKTERAIARAEGREAAYA